MRPIIGYMGAILLVMALALAGLGAVFSVDLTTTKEDHRNDAFGSREDTRMPSSFDVLASGQGGAGDAFGRSITGIDDLDGDSMGELLVGAPGNDTAGAGAGAVLFFSGGANLAPNSLDDPQQELVITGESAGDGFGAVIENIGDFDNNGAGDIAISAPGYAGTGAVFIFSMGTLNTLFSSGGIIDSTNADQRIDGNFAGEEFGASVAPLGDLDSDLYEDIMIGCPGNDTDAGRMVIYNGRPFTTPLATPSYIIESPAAGARFGEDLDRIADTDGDGFDDFLIGAPGADAAYLFYSMFLVRADLWDNDSDGIVDFTGSIQSTGDTWGLPGADDGWDTDTGTYGGVETEVQHNPASTTALEIVLGGQTGMGFLCSGAYGIEFTLTPVDHSKISKAFVEFSYTWNDAQGYENDERQWIKSRITYESGPTTTYLGSDLDTGGTQDGTDEIWSRIGTGNPASGSGTFKQDITNLLSGPGDYYFDVGGKITKWTTAQEDLTVTFDDVTIYYYTNTSDQYVQINGTPGSGLGYSLSTLGDLNADVYEDFILGAPGEDAAYLFHCVNWTAGTFLNTSADAYADFTGPAGSQLGFCVNTAGDYGGNADEDILIGAPYMNVSGNDGAGALFLYFSDGITASNTVGGANFTFDGAAADDHMGTFARAVGDLNKDGILDMSASKQSFSNFNDYLNWGSTGTAFILSQINRPPVIAFNYPGPSANISGMVTINVSCYDLDGDSIAGGVTLFHSQNLTIWVPIGNDPDADYPYYEVAWNTLLWPNGVYTLRAEAADDRGGVNHTDLPDITVYNPPRPILTPVFPQDDDLITGVKDLTVKAVLFTNISAPGVSFFISDDNSTWTLIGNTTAEKTLDVYNTTFDSTNFEDGKYYFMFNVTDINGQKGNTTVSNVTILNEYSPDISFVHPVGGEVLAGNVSITVDVTDKDGDLDLVSEGVTIYYHRLTEGWTKIGTTGAPVSPGSSRFTMYLDTTILDNGDDYGFWAHAADQTGRSSDAFTPHNISIFNTFPPAIELLPPVEPLAGIVTLTANVTDLDRNINTTRGVQFSYSSDKTEWTYIGKETSPDDPKADELQYIFTWDVSGLANGDYWLKANVSDYHGLFAEDLLEAKVQVKNIHAPVIEIKKPEESAIIGGTTTIEVYAFDADGDIDDAGVRLYYAKPAGTPVWHYIGNTNTHNETFIYTLEWDTTGVENGNFILLANVTDLSGLKDEHKMDRPFEIENGDDTDGDGLPDAWEWEFFGGLDQGPGDDYDNDGYTNDQERRAGTDPADALDHPEEPEEEEENPAVKFLKNNWLWLVIALVVVVIIVVVIIVVMVATKKKREEKAAAKAKADEKRKALDELHASMDKMVADMQKMKVEPGSIDTEYIAPSTEFFADSSPVYESDQWGSAGSEDANVEDVYHEESPIYAVSQEDIQEEEEDYEDEEYGEEDEQDYDEDDYEDDYEDDGVETGDTVDAEDILALDEEDVDIDEDDVEIDISGEAIEEEDIEQEKIPRGEPPKKKGTPPKKSKSSGKKGKGKKTLDEIDEEDIDIEDSVDIRVR